MKKRLLKQFLDKKTLVASSINIKFLAIQTPKVPPSIHIASVLATNLTFSSPHLPAINPKQENFNQIHQVNPDSTGVGHPLHVAVQRGHLPIIRHLLDAEADPNVADRNFSKNCGQEGMEKNTIRSMFGISTWSEWWISMVNYIVVHWVFGFVWSGVEAIVFVFGCWRWSWCFLFAMIEMKIESWYNNLVWFRGGLEVYLIIEFELMFILLRNYVVKF